MIRPEDAGTTLYDYGQRPSPELTLRQCIRHPESETTVIGHYALDTSRDKMAAMFPRNREDHYYRKFSGYAISESVLRGVRARGVESIYIIEQDHEHRFLEFDPVAFFTSEFCVAYSSDLDTVVEGEDEIEAADGVMFSDRQRVVPEYLARTTWSRGECSVSQP